MLKPSLSTKRGPMLTGISKQLFFDAAQEIASITRRGALLERPAKYYRIIDAALADDAVKNASLARQKEIIESSIWWLTHSAPKSNEHRIAKNAIHIQYATLMTNALDLLIADKKSGAGNFAEIKQDQPFLENITLGIRTAFTQMEFSQKYKDVEQSIRDSFLKAVKESGSLKSLFKWSSMDLTEREQAIAKIAIDDFMSAVRGVPEFAQMPPLAIQFMDLPKNTDGQYLMPDYIHFGLHLLAMDAADESLKTAVHEGGHHVDMFIEYFKPKGFEQDTELLAALKLLKRRTSIDLYKETIYAVTPDEKRPFESFVCDPVIALVNEHKNNAPSNGLVGLVQKTAKQVLRCVIG